MLLKIRNLQRRQLFLKAIEIAAFRRRP